MQYAQIMAYATRALGARPEIAEPIVMTIANKKNAEWSTGETVAYLAEQHGPDNPAADRAFVQMVREQLN